MADLTNEALDAFLAKLDRHRDSTETLCEASCPEPFFSEMLSAAGMMRKSDELIRELRAKLAQVDEEADCNAANASANIQLVRELRAKLAAAEAEVAEADGVIAVWRRRTETAERERDALRKVAFAAIKFGRAESEQECLDAADELADTLEEAGFSAYAAIDAIAGKGATDEQDIRNATERAATRAGEP